MLQNMIGSVYLGYVIFQKLLNSQKNINWLEIFEKSEKLGVKRILLINLILAKQLFELELPDEILIFKLRIIRN